VAFLEVAEDNSSLPGAFTLRVYNNLVAMPRLDRGQNTLALQPPDRYIAGPGAGSLFFMPLGQDLVLPLQVFARSGSRMQNDTVETGRENLITFPPIHFTTRAR
jgi:hypothetical protein